MRKRGHLLLKRVLLIGSMVAVLVLGWLGPVNAAKVTLDQLNKMRADVGLQPLSGEIAADIPLLQSECEQGIQSSCTVLDSILEQCAPSHPAITPDSKAPPVQETPISQEQEVKRRVD